MPSHVFETERRQRLSKLERLRAQGVDPYPLSFARDTAIAAATRPGAVVRIGGRIQRLRRHGGVVFATVADQSGSIQVLAARAALGDAAFAVVRALDRGDWVGVSGAVSADGSTVAAAEVVLLAKALRAPRRDPSARRAGRHVDLLTDPRTRGTLDTRAATLAGLRTALTARGFDELDAPDLRPLIVGGYERMFSVTPTRLTALAAFARRADLLELTESVLELARPWRRVTLSELIATQTGEHMRPDMPLEAARGICDELGTRFEAGWGAGRLMYAVYEHRVRPALREPTFVLAHPREVAPFARARDGDETFAEHVEAVVDGRRVAQVYALDNEPEAEDGGVLDYGLPPTGAVAFDLDRLVLLRSGAASLGDVRLTTPARRRRPDAPPAPEPRGPLRAPRGLATVTALAGVLLLFAGVEHDARGRVATVLAGLGLLVVAGQLRRAKRRAWSVAMALAGAAAGAALVRADPVAGAVATGLLLALVWHRDAFAAAPDPASRLDIARFLIRFVPAVLVFGSGTLLLERGSLSAGGVLETIALGLVGVDGPYTYTSPVLPAALPAAGIGGLIVLGLLAFRAVRAGERPSASERDRARALVDAHGSGTLDYRVLREDRHLFFSHAGDALLAYTFIAGTALVAGDPVGPPSARGRVIDEFLAHCRARGWTVAFVGPRERDLPLYCRHGLRGVYLGDEPVLRCDRFALDGLRDVRATVARVGRHCRFELVRATDLISPRREAIASPTDGRRLFALALGPDDRLLGWLQLTPCGGDEPGWTLEAEHAAPDAPDGVIGYLIAMTARELATRGFRRLSLSFSPWARLFARRGTLSPAQRVLRRAGRLLGPRAPHEGYAQFAPQRVRRSLVVEDLASIPKVGLLYAIVERRVSTRRRRDA